MKTLKSISTYQAGPPPENNLEEDANQSLDYEYLTRKEEFDRQGKVVRQVAYADDDEREVTTYEYDAWGRLIGTTSVVSSDDLVQHNGFRYDHAGRLLEDRATYTDGTFTVMTITYDDNERTEATQTTDSDGNGISNRFVHFDEQKRIVEEIDYVGEMNQENRFVYYFNEQKRLTERVQYDPDGEVVERVMTTGDEQDRIVEVVTLSPSGSMRKYRRYEYEQKENFSEEREIDLDDVVRLRRSEYYDPEARKRTTEIESDKRVTGMRAIGGIGTPVAISEIWYDEDGDITEEWDSVHRIYKYHPIRG